MAVPNTPRNEVEAQTQMVEVLREIVEEIRALRIAVNNTVSQLQRIDQVLMGIRNRP
jgi:hypothetical protein